MQRLGLLVLAGRQRMGVSQRSLEWRSGVDQTAISRLERGLAPRMSVERLTAISDTLGTAFPLGYCPHDHVCVWQLLKEGLPRMSPTRLIDERWDPGLV
jgi:transcriptional regulator with XRE-family HTH domain